MLVKYFTNQEGNLWDKFVSQQALDGGLLQAWPWGEFKQSLKQTVWRLAVMDGEAILLVAQIIKESLPAGFSYLYCPRGPVLKNNLNQSQQTAVLNFFLVEVTKLAKNNQAVFVRLEPTYQLPAVDRQLVASGQVQPKQTLILDLTKPASELLAQMKSKTRYNISVASKHGVQVRVASQITELDFTAFWELIKQTSTRQQISSHSQKYYQAMIKQFASRGQVKLYLADFQGRIIAVNLVVQSGNWAYYLHGASADADKNLMAPYLLQWQAILEAQAAGQKFYDFWGVSETKKSWAGITRFKQGFAPGQKFSTYPGCYDSVVNRFWYLAYQWLKKN
ncbi:MAG: peptidoglycan bridge formation glycyltransferase FemA/FemB family protein [Candidatus Buchananbacteria bacterium]